MVLQARGTGEAHNTESAETPSQNMLYCATLFGNLGIIYVNLQTKLTSISQNCLQHPE